MIVGVSAKAIVEIISLMLQEAERMKKTRHLIISSIMRVCKMRRDNLDVFILAPTVFHQGLLCDDIFEVYQAVYNACEMTYEEGVNSRVVIESKKEGQIWYKLIEGIPTRWMSHEEAKKRAALSACQTEEMIACLTSTTTALTSGGEMS